MIKRIYIPLLTALLILGCQYIPDKCIKDPLLCIPRPVPTASPSPTGTLPPVITPTPIPLPTVLPTEAPTKTPEPTPTPVQVGGCHLPRATGSGENCPRTSPAYLQDVVQSTYKVISEHPKIFSNDGTFVLPGMEKTFYAYLQANLEERGFCTFLDSGNEIALKKENSFSEQYATLRSDRAVRIGENTYRATCTPATKDIPPAEPIASDEADACLLVATVKPLGVNDGTLPPFKAGDTFHGDTTYRWACFEGDSRGMPCDKTCDSGISPCKGHPLEPAENPVVWSTNGPCGRSVEFNGGYGLNVKNLVPGDCTISVKPTVGAFTQEGKLIIRCPWGHGSSTPESITIHVE